MKLALRRSRVLILFGLGASVWALSGGCSDASGGVRNSGGLGQPDAGGAGSGIGGSGTGAGTFVIDGSTGSDASDSVVGTPCTQSATCGDRYVCANGACAVSEGDCVENANCMGDTFCCKEGCLPAGETGGKCVAYPVDGGFTDNCGEFRPPIGVFEARVQCEWLSAPSDSYRTHLDILTTPLTANLANESGAAAEIVAVAYDRRVLGPDYGVIRILNGQTCELLETIDGEDGNRISQFSTPAIGDLDGDGTPDIVALKREVGLIAFRWNAQTGKHQRYWLSDSSLQTWGAERWDAVHIHDLDDDGYPEVINGFDVHDGRSGRRITTSIPEDLNGRRIPVLGDIDNDGNVEYVAGKIYRWNRVERRWDVASPGVEQLPNYAFADFGTDSGGSFNPGELDGVAEIVGAGGGRIVISTFNGTSSRIVLDARFDDGGGGPPTVADFDGDGLPEVAAAGTFFFAVIDFDCAGGGDGCAGDNVRWKKPMKDESSAMTGAVAFDFDGDGKDEAVYGDECFTRVYAGPTGEVLFSSPRTSWTWMENPIVADPDRDQNTEIIVASSYGMLNCDTYDPNDRGIRCDANVDGGDCKSGTCSEGFCRCTSDADCDADYRCGAPLDGTPGSGNTCRAYHPTNFTNAGIRVLKDRLDRWVSSRPIWNQHAYSITNVSDVGRIPRTSEWQPNYRAEGMNNYRRNLQGAAAFGDMPDITGRLSTADLCFAEAGKLALKATVCNRGRRAVGAALPATFYLGDPEDGQILCTSFTSGPVPIGTCLEVSCPLTQEIAQRTTVTMVVNDDGAGDRTTLECDYANNRSAIEIESCVIPR